MSMLPDNTGSPVVVSGFQLPQSAAPDQSRFNRAVKDWIELRQGARANPGERAVTARDLQEHLRQLGVVTIGEARPSDDMGIMTVGKGGRGRWTGMDEFAGKIVGTKLFKDLTRRIDDPTRFDDLTARVKEILLTDLHEIAAKQGASVRQFQEIIQNERESQAVRVSEMTAAVAGATAGVRQLEAASASATRAVAVVATQITARLDDFPDVNAGSGVATVETVAQAIADRATGLEAQYVIKVSAGGYQAGIGLASTAGGTSGTPTSAFIVQADKFAIVDSSYTGGLTNSPPSDSLLFGVDGDGAYVGGNLKVAGKALIRGAYTNGGANAALHVNDTFAADNGLVSHADAVGGYAVYGLGASGSNGVYGESVATGVGVTGASASVSGGVGVRAIGALASIALDVVGPMQIDNSTLVTNLNADKLDGLDGSAYALAQTSTTYTVTDVSGAGLSLTANRQASYKVTGNIVHLAFDITFPTTSDTNPAQLSLPIAAVSDAAGGSSINYTTYSAASFTLYAGPGGSILYLAKMDGSLASNADFSGKRIQGLVVYFK
ncbi:phage tail tip fiber protein [Ramlibacter sp.]|uniref:phage tail tip fiber protein n=1 Tax=Ramlibacter sp. TaxID=1917967 RepID=UPI003D0AA843